MKDPTQRYNPLIDSIWMIPPENYTSQTDTFQISQNLIFVLYEHAIAYAQGKTGTDFEIIDDVPHEIQDEFFAQVAIAPYIFTSKALAALNMADPALAYRLLGDAEKLTEPKAYVEPFFYSLMLGIILGENEEYLENAAKRLREEAPYIKSRMDFLLSRVNEAWWELIKDKLQKLLSAT